MPKKENFRLMFSVTQEGEDNQYVWKVNASNEADAIAKAPKELTSASRTLGKILHNPRLVKVLMDFDNVRPS